MDPQHARALPLPSRETSGGRRPALSRALLHVFVLLALFACWAVCRALLSGGARWAHARSCSYAAPAAPEPTQDYRTHGGPASACDLDAIELEELEQDASLSCWCVSHAAHVALAWPLAARGLTPRFARLRPQVAASPALPRGPPAAA